MALSIGDKVVINTREVTNEDKESGLYYSYFGGLTGTVNHIYKDDTVCVDVDLDSLSEEARKRHLEMQEAERQRWLDNISADLKRRLTAEQKKLAISYKLLVSKKDLKQVK